MGGQPTKRFSPLEEVRAKNLQWSTQSGELFF